MDNSALRQGAHPPSFSAACCPTIPASPAFAERMAEDLIAAGIDARDEKAAVDYLLHLRRYSSGEIGRGLDAALEMARR